MLFDNIFYHTVDINRIIVGPNQSYRKENDIECWHVST
jgi:hypothetical protein